MLLSDGKIISIGDNDTFYRQGHPRIFPAGVLVVLVDFDPVKCFCGLTRKLVENFHRH